MDVWSGVMGQEYTDRNSLTPAGVEELYLRRFGLTRTAMNALCLENVDRSIRILEVGSNIGLQLVCLQSMGFESLYGVELQWYAVEKAKAETKKINIVQGSAFDIPFKDGFFDLVFTSGVLIHIAPDDLSQVQAEIYRCSRRYIWGYEYFSDRTTEVNYRGSDGLLWKSNFSALYRERFLDLRLVNERKYKYSDSDNVDSMFLLEKARI